MREVVIPNMLHQNGRDMDYAVQNTSVSAVSPSGLRLAVALEQISNEATSESATTSTSLSTGQSPHSASQHQQEQTASLSPNRDADSSPNIAPNERGYSNAIPSHPPPWHRVAIATNSCTTTSWTTTASRGASSSSPLLSTPPSSASDDYPTVVTCSVKAPVTALQWLDDSHLACGLQDGTVTLLARDARSNFTESMNLGDSAAWTPTLSRCFHRVTSGGSTPNDQGRRRVVRIRLSGHGSIGGKDGMGGIGAARGSGRLGGGPGDALTLWILYEDRVVVCVSAEALVMLARQRADSVNTATTDETSTTADQQPHSPGSPSSPPSSGSGPSFAKLQLEGQDEILDVAACPAPAGLFELRQDRHSHVVLAAGMSPALAFYLVGSETRSIGLASIAWAVASRVTSLTVGAIDGIFGFVGLRGRGRRRRKVAASAEVSARGGSEDGDGREESPPPLVLRWDGGLQDGRRRVTSLCLDPSGRFAAAADGFGRVMLVDCATRQILRMWKGVRDAQCGWLEVAESWVGRQVSSVGANGNENQSALDFATNKITTNDADDSAVTPVIGLYLAILAPLRGRVDIWRMRHGPCVRVVSAPTGARLLTSKSIARGQDEARNDGGEAGEGGGATALTSCYLLSGGSTGAATGEAVTRLRLNPLVVEEADLARLPTRLSREATVNDDCRLRQFGAALAEITRSQTATATSETQTSTVDDRERLPAGGESREEILFRFLAQLESVENLARGIVALGGRRGNERGRDETRHTGTGSARSNDGIALRPRASQAPQAPSPPVRPGEQSSRSSSTATRTGAVVLSHSFHSRVCALCRERAEQASTETASRSAAFDSDLELDNEGKGAQDAQDSGRAAAVAVLRFRANSYALYALLSSVEIQPAGAAGEDEDGDPAFLPPGKRGWKHALLCEEAAGWAEMARERGGSPGGARLLSAELPDFQEFFDTVSRVLELPQPAPPPQGKFLRAMGNDEPSIPLLRFIEAAGDRDTTEGATGSRSRRSSGNGKASPESEVPSISRISGEGIVPGGTSSADVLESERARCRERLIAWLFRPLLSDAFAMASLTQALNMLAMGGRSQAVALVRDMSAWFLALPVGRAADITVGREAQNCPVLRWLKAIIVATMARSDEKSNLSASGSSAENWERDSDRRLGEGEKSEKTEGVLKKEVDRVAGVSSLFGDDDVANAEAQSKDVQGVAAAVSKGSVDGATDASSGGEDEQEDDEEHKRVGDDSGDDDDDDVDRTKDFQAEAEALLQPIYDACAASQQLENAVMLAVVTAEALAASRERLEESSLGRVAIGGGEAWDALARRLRVCLFVDHRLWWGVPQDDRNRASVRQFEEGKASVYALVAKDQLISFDDLSFAACSSRENAEVEASVRSQREAAEAKTLASRERSGPELAGKVGQEAVAAAPTLADSSMDKYWREVQAVAARKGDPASKPKTSSLPSSCSDTFSLNLAIAGLSTTGTVTVDKRANKKGNNPARPNTPAAVVGQSQQSKRQSSTSSASTTAQTARTTLFFMRSHAQPIVLACHRARWLVRSWAAIGPAAARDTAKAESAIRPLSSVAEKARAAEGAVRLLSLAVDHLSYLRTAKPFLAACVGYWLWEHGGVRAHAGELARGIVTHNGVDDDIPVTFAESSKPQVSTGKSDCTLTEAGRPTREAFLAAAEEFLHVEALFPGGRQEDATRGGRWGSSGGSEKSFLSLLTAGTVQRCPWPGAWDVWLEECLRDAQVHPPLPQAVAAHATLLRALRVSTVCGLQEGETQRLFAHGNALCTEASLRNERLATPASVRDVNDEGARIVACREAYVRRALEAIVPRPAQNVYRLARDFGLGEDTVRGWHCLVLLRRGHDVLGEEAMAQVYSLQELAGEILTILRLRLKRILDYLETSPKSSGGLLASLDADACEWVRSAKDSEAESAAGIGAGSDKAKGEPLRSTHGVLLCLGRALPPDSRYKRQANSLLTLVGTMLRHLDGAMF